MILRRLTKHVKEQNWFAVFLDFVIVVVGVFIGIQVSNWNAARADAREYALARERLATEIAANLAILDDVDAALRQHLAEADAAFDLLLSCAADTPETRQTVSEGLMAINGSMGIALRDSALLQITENPRLLAQQGEGERAAFSDLRYQLEFLQTEAKYAEDLPLGNPPASNPVVAIGPAIIRESEMADGVLRRKLKSLVLGVPMNVACTDNDLLKSFYHWERWQEQQLALSDLMREKLEKAMTGSEDVRVR